MRTRLERRGWTRSRARDYDLWRVLKTYRNELQLDGFLQLLRRKCELRGVGFGGTDDFFRQPMLALIEQTWEHWLGALIGDMPAFETVVSELRLELDRLLAGPG